MIETKYIQDYILSIDNDKALYPLSPINLTSFEHDNFGFIEFCFIQFKKNFRKKRFKKQKRISLVIGCGSTFNAYSIKSKGEKDLYYIVINRGLIIRLWALVELFGLDDKNRIKDSYWLANNSNTFEQIVCANIDIFNLYHELNCSEKQKNSVQIILYSIIEHVIYHELAHILHGHVDWLNVVNENNILEENTTGAKYSLKDYRKYMEYCADDTAVWMCLNDNLDKESPILSKVNFDFEYGQFVSHYLYGSMIFLHCFEDFDESIFQKEESSYPHPEIRANIIYASIKNYVTSIFESEEYIKHLYKEVDEGFRSVYLALKKYLSHKPFPNSFSSDNPGDWLLKEVAKYNKRRREDNEEWNEFDVLTREKE